MKIFPPHRRGRRPRRPAPLAVSTAISFVLSAQCCSAQILDNLNLVTSSGTSHFWETEIEPFPYNVLANFLLPQNRCRSLRIYVALRNKKAVQNKSKKHIEPKHQIKPTSKHKPAPLFYPLAQRKSAKSEAILRHSKLARIIRRGEHRSPAWYATSTM